MNKLYIANQFNRYFPTLRGAVWLILLPAVIVIIFNFFSFFNEIVIHQERSPMINYEKKYAALKNDLPGHAFVNFVSDGDTARDFFAARYVLIPVRLMRGLEPPHDYLVVRFSDPAKIPSYEGYNLKKDYGNGVLLFSRSIN